MGIQSIFDGLARWAGSLTGILTIFIIVAVILRISLSAIRDKHGKDSRAYRTAKLIVGAMIAIFIVNCIGTLFRRIGVFIASVSGGVIGFSTDVTNSIIADNVASTIALVAICAGLIILAFCNDFGTLIWIGWIIATGGVHAIYGNILATCIFGIVYFLWFGWMHLEIGLEWFPQRRAKTWETDGTPKSTKKTVIMAILWAGSVVLAYIAGEKSLIPSAVEYMHTYFEKVKAEKEAKAQAKAATEEAKEKAEESTNDAANLTAAATTE